MPHTRQQNVEAREEFQCKAVEPPVFFVIPNLRRMVRLGRVEEDTVDYNTHNTRRQEGGIMYARQVVLVNSSIFLF
jgi:hypothetical protein